MKFTHLFLVIFLAAATARADKPSAGVANPIPWNQIGAKAGADYQGDGLAVTATDSGARLHCIFQRLDGDASSEGLWLTSTASATASDHFRVVATGISRASDFGLRRQSEASTPLFEQLPSTGNISLSSQTVRFTRPGLTEEYSVSMDGIRQDFIIEQQFATAAEDHFPSPGGPQSAERSSTLGQLTGGGLGKPLGRGEGEHHLKIDSALRTPHSALILQLSLSGATVEPAPDGATLILANSGRRIAYNRLRVTDATGKALPAHIEVLPVGDEMTSLKSLGFNNDIFGEMSLLTSAATSAKLSVVVDDTDATYPLRIDPTFSDANWISLGGYPGVNGFVYAAVVDGAGNLFVGGTISVAGGTFAQNIAEWNGTKWIALGAGINGTVRSLAVTGGTLYAGGNFSQAGGISATNIARWDGTNWFALGSGLINGRLGPPTVVYALVVAGDTLYAGGVFTNAGGSLANNVAQWNGATWSPLGSGVGGEGSYTTVSTLAVSGGTLFAGGFFTTAGGLPVNYIAQWNGTNWSALGSGINGTVSVLAVSGKTLYAGGRFATAGGVAVTNIAQWDGTNWSSVGPGLPTATDTSPVISLAVLGNTLYAGGDFFIAGNSTGVNIAQWDGTNWLSLQSGVYNLVYTLAVSGGILYASGVTHEGIAQYNGTGWSDVGPGMANSVAALLVSSNTLYVGGHFTTAGAGAANFIAQWNGTSWSSLGSGMNNAVLALAMSGSTLYAGGNFTTAGGSSANCIAQWDGTNWSPLGSGMNNPVYALVATNGRLYVGGDFTNAGGGMANHIAQWDGHTWSSLGSGMEGDVDALATAGGILYAGGGFSTAGGNPATNIAQWNGVNWSALGAGLANGSVAALAVSRGNLYAGGYFSTAGGKVANHIAQWNGSNWSPLGSGVDVYVYSLAASGGTLYVGGFFRSAGGLAANSIALWDGNRWWPVGSGVAVTFEPNLDVNAIAISGNTLYAGGNFLVAGTNVSACVAEAILPVTVTILTTDGNFGITNGAFGFNVSGPSGSNVIIQASADLQSWTPLQTNQLTNGLFYFSDSQPLASSRRFYRAQLSP